LQKLGVEYVKNELEAKGIAKESIKKILELIKSEINGLKKYLKANEGIAELEELFGLLGEYGVKSFKFDASLARGLSYYTGIVFEVYLKNSDIKSSVAGGGRYDKMISQFLETKKEFPAVGISFGLDVISDAAGVQGKKSVVDVFVAPIKTGKQCIAIVKELRKAGIKTLIDLLGRGPSKNMSYANAMGIPFVILVGETEIKQKKVKLRDMKTGREEMLSLNDAIKRIGQ